jgi:hypothetical protein
VCATRQSQTALAQSADVLGFLCSALAAARVPSIIARKCLACMVAFVGKVRPAAITGAITTQALSCLAAVATAADGLALDVVAVLDAAVGRAPALGLTMVAGGWLATLGRLAMKPALHPVAHHVAAKLLQTLSTAVGAGGADVAAAVPVVLAAARASLHNAAGAPSAPVASTTGSTVAPSGPAPPATSAFLLHAVFMLADRVAGDAVAAGRDVEEDAAVAGVVAFVGELLGCGGAAQARYAIMAALVQVGLCWRRMAVWRVRSE